MDQLTKAEVESAAQGPVAAFAATDTNAYFDCFADDATFVCHSGPEAIIFSTTENEGLVAVHEHLPPLTAGLKGQP